ncbi:MAG: hypothetical protein WCC74_02920 [Minisyncoccia bacterium]
MQNKLFSYCFIVFISLFSFGFYTNAFAESATTTSSLINAEILSNIWYSTTTLTEGNEITIYAGFQNHSNKNLSGTAGFYLDNIQIGKVDFTANSKSLIKLENKYTAVRGEHTAQVKVLDIVEMRETTPIKLAIENLLASETEKKGISVKYQITTADVLNTAQNVSNNIVNNINTYTENAADYLESLKQPTGDTNVTNTTNIINNNSPISSVSSSLKNGLQTVQNKLTGKILGTSTKNMQVSSTQNMKVSSAENSVQQTATSWKTYFYNLFLDILAFLLRHWVWTFVAFLILILYLTLR